MTTTSIDTPGANRFAPSFFEASEEAPPPLQFPRRAASRPLRRLVHRARRLRTPRLSNYAPVSMLELPDHTPSHAAFRAIDFHAHLGRWLSSSGGWMEDDVNRLLEVMDALNIEAMVNLDGRWGVELEENLDRYDRAYPGRFFSFCHLDWRLLDEPDGAARLVESLRRSVDAGARGLKVWKDLGLTVTARDRRILPDDPLLAPVWTAAAELRIPVLVHVADPVAFFHPVDRHNERLEELLRTPRSSRSQEGIKEFHRLLDSFEHVVASHPATCFVAAHGLHVENLAHVSGWLDRYPNLYIDMAGRAPEFGRQPRTSRALLVRHPDRVIFGTDIFPIEPRIHQVYFRLLETDDEAFTYSPDRIPPNGRWPIYGLGLPEDVLLRIYRDNACRLLGSTTRGDRQHEAKPRIWPEPTGSPR
jgi:predicted TIM-barrel fold metal-dependent hydrolase